MHSCKVRLEQIADPGNLRVAFLRAACGKGARADVIAFRAHLDAELAALRAVILDGTVAVGAFTAFTIFEPKERRIHAPCFRERVLHHALVGPCEADFERWSIDDSFACRRGKGREAALHRAEHYARRHPWFLKLDIAKYFDSIPHEVLRCEIARRFRDARVVDLWSRIVRAYEKTPGRGLPIGALTSQHLANFFLGAADRRIKETLRVPGYARYMDDMALWGGRDELKHVWRDLAAWFPAQLGLTVKANAHLQPTVHGMDFLGYRVRPEGASLNRASRRRFVRRWSWCERARETGHITELQAQRRVSALAAFVRSASRERILERLFGVGRAATPFAAADTTGSRPSDGGERKTAVQWPRQLCPRPTDTTFRTPAIGHQPRQPRRQLEQHRHELPLRQPQQEHPGQPQQQPGFPPRPQLTPTHPDGCWD